MRFSYEKRTFRALVILILSFGQGEHGKERYEGCIFLFVPLAIYFAESAALFLTGGDILHILPGNGELFSSISGSALSCSRLMPSGSCSCVLSYNPL